MDAAWNTRRDGARHRHGTRCGALGARPDAQDRPQWVISGPHGAEQARDGKPRTDGPDEHAGLCCNAAHHPMTRTHRTRPCMGVICWIFCSSLFLFLARSILPLPYRVLLRPCSLRLRRLSQPEKVSCPWRAWRPRASDAGPQVACACGRVPRAAVLSARERSSPSVVWDLHRDAVRQA